jgi:formylglycine-generating enzyme required for sulfatase activity
MTHAGLSVGLGLLGVGLAVVLRPPEEARARAPLPLRCYTETIPGTKVTFEMVPIPGGKFLMGSPEGEKGRGADEGPQHLVEIDPFWMGKCEVTWDEFDVFLRQTSSEGHRETVQERQNDLDAITGPSLPYVDPDYGHGHVSHPAICMTQHCAMEYCRWLSRRTGKAYRLPTEAEWEHAARAGTETVYSFGNNPELLGEYAWFEGNSEETSHKVGTKKPNPWGLHDMYGNVSEWCLDHYEKDHYATFPADKAALNPVLVPTEKRFSHVVRGGSWADPAVACRSATRRGSDKTWMRLDPCRPQSIWWLAVMDMVGFRVVRAVEEQPALKGIRSKVTPASK